MRSVNFRHLLLAYLARMVSRTVQSDRRDADWSSKLSLAISVFHLWLGISGIIKGLKSGGSRKRARVSRCDNDSDLVMREGAKKSEVQINIFKRFLNSSS